jgi:tRNA(Ile)-lysidine synthase
MPESTPKPAFSDFLRKVERTIITGKMIQPNDAVLVCVSGGPDSVALLHALHWLSSRYSLHLGIAHVNHQLRGRESDADARFVQTLAEKMKLRFHRKPCDVREYARTNRLSLEDAGRQVRYDFFLQLAMGEPPYTKIATAHHMDDNAELVLMNLLRGSGKTGISGIRPIRENRIIRPLLHVSKQEILAFLSQYRLPYRLDRSNQDDTITRNRIRNRLIPALQSDYNPRIIEAVNRLAVIVQQEEEWITSIVDGEMNQLIVSGTDQSVWIDAAGLADKPLPLQRRVIRSIINKVKGNIHKITLRHVDDVLSLIARSVHGSELHLPDGILVRIEGGHVCFRIQKRIARPATEKSVKMPVAAYYHVLSSPDELPKAVHIHEAGAWIQFTVPDRNELPEPSPATMNTALMDLACLSFPLTIRNCMPGDRFTPLGMTGHQKISKFFINRKIPRGMRADCPVLISQDRIVWLCGHQIDDAVKITPATRRILKAELFLA